MVSYIHSICPRFRYPVLSMRGVLSPRIRNRYGQINHIRLGQLSPIKLVFGVQLGIVQVLILCILHTKAILLNDVTRYYIQVWWYIVLLKKSWGNICIVYIQMHISILDIVLDCSGCHLWNTRLSHSSKRVIFWSS